MTMKTIKRDLKDTGLLPDSAGILDVVSSGRYWRNSHLIEISLICRESTARTDSSNTAGGRETLSETIFRYEKEADDFEILPLLAEHLSHLTEIITFNGHTFDLPYLRRKYAAYDLKDPFESLCHTDLYALYRPLVRILALPSGKLVDFYELSGNDAANLLQKPRNIGPAPSAEQNKITDALRTLSILDLKAYLAAFDGKGTYKSGKLTEDHLYLAMSLEDVCPHELSLHDTVFHIRITKDVLICGIPVENGKIRIYHTDLANYVFLPYEGYAVHKSVARFVDRSRTQKVTRETCFHYAEATPRIAEDPDSAMQVLRSVLAYIKTR